MSDIEIFHQLQRTASILASTRKISIALIEEGTGRKERVPKTSARVYPSGSL